MDVHYIETNKDYKIAYFTQSKRFFKVNQKAVDLINCVLEGDADEKITEKLGVSSESLERYNKKILDSCQSSGSNIESSYNATILGRLVIHIVNGCNLRCEYCYANGGSYHSEAAFITNETIDKIFQVFYEKYNHVNVLQLFGGEPLMNMDGIEYICKIIKEKNEESGKKTIIGLVTNGTLINDRFIALVKKYDIQVTISYDGNVSVNNMLRHYPDGTGTSKLILENARRLKNETGQPTQIETTYAKRHIDNNVSILDIIKHIYEELPNTRVHLVPAGGDCNTSYVLKDNNAFVDSIDEIFEENNSDKKVLYTYSLMQRIINSIADKHPAKSSICDAGLGTMSVSVNGDLYPCFMLTDNEEQRLGNIYDQNPLDSKRYKDMLIEFNRINMKNTHDKCQKCFVKDICTGCMGLNLMNTGDIALLDEKYCEMTRLMSEKILVHMAELT